MEDTRMEDKAMKKLLRIIDGTRERAELVMDHDSIQFKGIKEEMRFLEIVTVALAQRQYHSPMSTVILGIVSLYIQNPELAKRMIEAFNSILVKHMMDDLLKSVEGRKHSQHESVNSDDMYDLEGV